MHVLILHETDRKVFSCTTNDELHKLALQIVRERYRAGWYDPIPMPILKGNEPQDHARYQRDHSVFLMFAQVQDLIVRAIDSDNGEMALSAMMERRRLARMKGGDFWREDFDCLPLSEGYNLEADGVSSHSVV